ncbi:Hypothetical protein DHA2_152186 [Giardia duodenalis]|uniref:Uncharacterized protein n=1 Tax=Giardia intestinalis TaxID=5741 RepID=V6TD75_GIAIN|nr:Hypothetical protein DHA2_152186 [Giardia intestinalis]
MTRLLPRRLPLQRKPVNIMTAMYRSAPRTITPQERCDLGPALTHPVPTEVRENCIISWPPVGVLLSRPSSVQLVKRARTGVSYYSRPTHQPDGRAVAHELRLMLVGFLLVCVTVLEKDSGKDTCFPGYALNTDTKKCDRNSDTHCVEHYSRCPSTVNDLICVRAILLQRLWVRSS